ncbi:MAG: carboxypeptidase-like regulatory domain-containing protein, partial [Nitrososphaerales archaeon]
MTSQPPPPPPNGDLQVIAYDESTGDPIDGASVQMTVAPSGQPLESCTTDSSGQCTFSSILTGSYSVSVSASGYQPGTGSGSVSSGQTGEVTVTLAPIVSLYSVTFTESGTSALTWSVTFNGGTQLSSSDSITFSNVANGDYEWSVTPPTGYVAVTSSGSVTVAGANVNQPITFESTLAVSISPSSASLSLGGFVQFTAFPTGGTGTYTDYLWTWVQQPGGNTGTYDSGTSNTYAFTPSSVATYEVWVVVTDSSGAQNIAPSSTVTVGGTQSTDLQVLAYSVATGDPVSGASAVMTSAPAGQQLLSGTTDSGGQYTFSNVLAGQYVVEISASGYQTQTSPPITVVSGQTEPYTFELSSTLLTTSTTVTCSPSTQDVGYNSKCSATVFGGSTPSGVVTFSSSSNTGTFSPSNGQCTLSSETCAVYYSDTTVG